MSELMKNILADKLKTRKRLAALPVEQKIALMEKMRDRSRLLAVSALRKRYADTTPFIVVSGDGEVLSEAGGHKWAMMPPVVRLFPDQSNIRQTAESLFEESKTQPEYWSVSGSAEQ